MRHFDTFNIRKRIAAEVGTVWCDYIRFDDDITTATVVKHFRQREICKYNVRKQRRRDLFTLKTYSTMETQQQINELQSRQLELRAIMASSDERAAKCFKTERRFVKHTPTISPDTRPQTPNTTETNRRWPNSKRREKRNEPRKSRRIISTPYEPIDRTIDNGRNHRAKLDDSNIDVDFLSSSCGFDHLVGRCGCGYRLRSLFGCEAAEKG